MQALRFDLVVEQEVCWGELHCYRDLVLGFLSKVIFGFLEQICLCNIAGWKMDPE